MSDQKPELRKSVVLRQEDFGGLIFDKSLNRIHQINETAYNILFLCNGQNSMSEIIEMVSHNYSLDKETAKETVDNFIGIMKTKNILD